MHTHYAIILPLHRRHFETLLLRSRPWLREYVVDDCYDWVIRKAHGPREVRDGVIFYDVPKVAPALHRVPGHAAGRQRARTSTHRDRVCRVPHMRDVVGRRLYSDALRVSEDT